MMVTVLVTSNLFVRPEDFDVEDYDYCYYYSSGSGGGDGGARESQRGSADESVGFAGLPAWRQRRQREGFRNRNMSYPLVFHDGAPSPQ